MPKLLRACAPQDREEERKIRKLAGSRHAPGDWITRAGIISLSWRGLRTTKIAEELGCHPKTVRTRGHRFNVEGIDGLVDRPGAGRKPRITEDERSRIIALVSKDPPGRLVRYDGLPHRRPSTRPRQPTGPWMHSPMPYERWASRSAAAR